MSPKIHNSNIRIHSDGSVNDFCASKSCYTASRNIFAFDFSTLTNKPLNKILDHSLFKIGFSIYSNYHWELQNLFLFLQVLRIIEKS